MPDVKDKTVIVVGGGLTSGHLSLLALRAGCEKVILMCRHCLNVKPFDLDLNWQVLPSPIIFINGDSIFFDPINFFYYS